MVTPFTDENTIDYDGMKAQTDWFVQQGVAGLFTVSMSSEMYYLSDEERLGLATAVVKAAAGRIGVVASGTFGGPLESQAEFVKRTYDTGVDAVVVIASQLADEEAGDSDWLRAAEMLMVLAEGVPLGIYECPRPYHRLLSPKQIGSLAATGRYLFHKDTCTDIEAIRAKVAATRDTPFGFFNAQTATLLDSLKAGAEGYSGTAANFFPCLHAWLCAHHRDEPETAAALQRFLSTVEPAVRTKYPNSAKLFESLYGVPIRTHSRMRDEAFRDDDHRIFGALKEAVEAWRGRLGIG
jgi:4-hydroxy-tetrahydrodipicolinate synthase